MPQPLTRRSQLKADRRHQLLDAAAHLVAERGFHGVRLEDLGAAVGISGPAVYRHFSNKEAVLVELLVGISEHLQSGGEDVVRSSTSPVDAVRGLVDFHLDFALTSPGLISVQGRDLANLPPTARGRVRRLQRLYVELWVQVLCSADSGRTEDTARVQAHAAFGLLNSTPHSTGRVPDAAMKAVLSRMALSALAIDVRNDSRETA
ncbi:putative transcriptional regulator, TetR family protein [Rhodococcoides trifolii]|uniref:Transcriptional regulator, TetR family protein n=2 Tax=Rhodococcoides trifolii TaxID=908250 RepID=A0A917CPV7_9NOCA|nr:putative transcriptional regulator, TetR family protein [Rhodococcus trifolii]